MALHGIVRVFGWYLMEPREKLKWRDTIAVETYVRRIYSFNLKEWSIYFTVTFHDDDHDF